MVVAKLAFKNAALIVCSADVSMTFFVALLHQTRPKSFSTYPRATYLDFLTLLFQKTACTLCFTFLHILPNSRFTYASCSLSKAVSTTLRPFPLRLVLNWESHWWDLHHFLAKWLTSWHYLYHCSSESDQSALVVSLRLNFVSFLMWFLVAVY